VRQAQFFCVPGSIISLFHCGPIIFTILLILTLAPSTEAQTSRTAESMLGKRHSAIVTQPSSQQNSITSRATEEMVSGSSHNHGALKTGNKTDVQKGPAASSSPVAQPGKSNAAPRRKARHIRARSIVNGVKMEILSCQYVPQYKSVTCNFKATNLEPAVEAVVYCYTGTKAVDDQGTAMQCAHAWLGSNHSWNYAHGKLEKGTPVNGMIRLETRRAPAKLKRLEVSLSINGSRQKAVIKNLPVK